MGIPTNKITITNRAILVSDTGNRMSVSNLQSHFRRYLEKSGLGNELYNT